MKIYEQLLQHWTMCQALRHNVSTRLRDAGTRYFVAKKQTNLDPLERRAVAYVTEAKL